MFCLASREAFRRSVQRVSMQIGTLFSFGRASGQASPLPVAVHLRLDYFPTDPETTVQLRDFDAPEERERERAPSPP